MGAAHYKTTKVERGRIERELKKAALTGKPNALLAYANLQLAQAIAKQTEQAKAV